MRQKGRQPEGQKWMAKRAGVSEEGRETRGYDKEGQGLGKCHGRRKAAREG